MILVQRFAKFELNLWSSLCLMKFLYFGGLQPLNPFTFVESPLLTTFITGLLSGTEFNFSFNNWSDIFSSDLCTPSPCQGASEICSVNNGVAVCIGKYHYHGLSSIKDWISIYKWLYRTPPIWYHKLLNRKRFHPFMRDLQK